MVEITNFQRYSTELDATEKLHLSRKEAAELHKKAVKGDQEAWHTLWLHGTRLVLKIVNKLHARGLLQMEKEDAVAEGNLAIGNALLRWRPAKSRFGTWVWIRVRGAILSEDAKHQRGFLVGDAEDAPDVVSSSSSYTGGDAERGFDLTEVSEEGQTPEDALRNTEVAELLDAIESLPSREYEYIFRHYICDESQRDIAFSEGISERMIRKIMERGIIKLKTLLK